MVANEDFEAVEVWRRIRRAMMELQAPPVGARALIPNMAGDPVLPPD